MYVLWYTEYYTMFIRWTIHIPSYPLSWRTNSFCLPRGTYMYKYVVVIWIMHLNMIYTCTCKYVLTCIHVQTDKVHGWCFIGTVKPVYSGHPIRRPPLYKGHFASPNTAFPNHFDLHKEATSLQWPLFRGPYMATIDRFHCSRIRWCCSITSSRWEGVFCPRK